MAAAANRLRSVLRALGAAVEAEAPPAYDAAELEATTRFADDDEAPLTEEMIAQFMVEGYVVLPGILRDEHVAHLCADVDQLVADRDALVGQRNHLPGTEAAPSLGGSVGRHVVSYEHLGKLCTHPPLLEKVKQLMARYGDGRTDCAMHHIHASKNEAGDAGVGWHQDYHCSPAVYDREQLMVHCFCCELRPSSLLRNRHLQIAHQGCMTVPQTSRGSTARSATSWPCRALSTPTGIPPRSLRSSARASCRARKHSTICLRVLSSSDIQRFCTADAPSRAARA